MGAGPALASPARAAHGGNGRSCGQTETDKDEGCDSEEKDQPTPFFSVSLHHGNSGISSF